MIASELVATNAFQIAGVGVRPSKAKPFASAKPGRALTAFSPSLPSISPGEKPARSSRTCSRTIAGSSLSLGGALPFQSAVLTDATSSPACAGPTRQTSIITPASQRFKAISEVPSDKDRDGSEFLFAWKRSAGRTILAGNADARGRLVAPTYQASAVPL